MHKLIFLYLLQNQIIFFLFLSFLLSVFASALFLWIICCLMKSDILFSSCRGVVLDIDGAFCTVFEITINFQLHSMWLFHVLSSLFYLKIYHASQDNFGWTWLAFLCEYCVICKDRKYTISIKHSFNLDTVATSFHNLVWSKTAKRFIPFFYEDEYGNSCVMLET